MKSFTMVSSISQRSIQSSICRQSWSICSEIEYDAEMSE